MAKDPTPSPAEVAWEILAGSAPRPRPVKS